MDRNSIYAIKLLETLANCNAMLINLAQQLQSRPEILKVSNTLEVRKYQTGSMIEGTVDAELQNNQAVCWSLEVSWTSESWIIDTRILINDSHGQETAYKFPDNSAIEFEELISALTTSTEELTQFDGLSLAKAKI